MRSETSVDLNLGLAASALLERLRIDGVVQGFEGQQRIAVLT